MELRQLEHYLAVAAEMNFSRAAVQAQITQSALSASIGKLETELGIALIDRSKRQIRLTPAGVVFLRRAQEAIAAALRAKNSVEQFRSQLTGNINFGTMMTCGPLNLPAALAEFRHAHPLVTVRLVQNREGSTGSLRSIVTGELDLALVSLPSVDHDFVAVHELASEQLILVCDPTHELAARTSVELTELAQHEIIHFPRGWGIRERLQASLTDAGVDPIVPYEVANYELAAELVRNRLAITIIPASVARRSPDLVGIDLNPAVRWTVFIAQLTPSLNRPIVSTLIDTLWRHLGS